MTGMGSNDTQQISEEDKTKARRRLNGRIAHWCSFAALIIILVDFAALVIGQATPFFTEAGIMISIALLAIAALKNPTRPASKK